jgi:predicted phosphodiesterase
LTLHSLFAVAAVVYRVAVVGDTGNGSAEVAKGIGAIGPVDAIVLTGDNIYPCGVKSRSDAKWSVLEPLSRLGVPIYPVLGNHDHCGNADAQINAPLPNWHFPSREYSIATPFADFAFIDTTPYVRGLSTAPHFSFGDKWRVVVGHHPLLSSGYHGHFPRDEHRSMVKLLPVMRDADLYLCGHDHHLELIDGSPTMLISGAGSAPVPPLLAHAKTRWAGEGRYRGFAVVEFEATTMRIRFYDANGKAVSAAFLYVKKHRP